MITEWQLNVTTDHQTGNVTAYILEQMDPTGQWLWLADADFGPFDTASDLGRWLVKVLVQRKAFQLR